jgi:hypothetical protein
MNDTERLLWNFVSAVRNAALSDVQESKQKCLPWETVEPDLTQSISELAKHIGEKAPSK